MTTTKAIVAARGMKRMKKVKRRTQKAQPRTEAKVVMALGTATAGQVLMPQRSTTTTLALRQALYQQTEDMAAC